MDGFRSLPAAARRYLVGTLINMIGTGMHLTFVFMYLNEVRGFSRTWTGWIMTTATVVTLACTTPGGWLTDRFGARKTLSAATLYSASVFGLYILTKTVWLALGASVLMGLGQALSMPAQQAYVSTIVSDAQRPSLAAWMRVVLNTGVGIGATLAGLFVRVSKPWTFFAMFLFNVSTFLLYFAIIRAIRPPQFSRNERLAQPEPSHPEQSHPEQSHPEQSHPERIPEWPQQRDGYAQVLRDRFFVRLLGVDITSGLSFGLLFLVMPTMYIKQLGASEATVGFVMTAGTLSVVVSQLPVARFVRGRDRMKTLSAMQILFALGFICALITVSTSVNTVIAMVTIAQVLGGVGEACLGPVRSPLTADLAPPHLIGRYFGLSGMLFQGGWGLANGLGGMALDWNLQGLWSIGVFLALGGASWSLRLSRSIPSRVRFSPGAESL